MLPSHFDKMTFKGALLLSAWKTLEIDHPQAMNNLSLASAAFFSICSKKKKKEQKMAKKHTDSHTHTVAVTCKPSLTVMTTDRKFPCKYFLANVSDRKKNILKL